MRFQLDSHVSHWGLSDGTLWDMSYLLVHLTPSFMCADGPSGLTVVNNNREYPSEKRIPQDSFSFEEASFFISLFRLWSKQ